MWIVLEGLPYRAALVNEPREAAMDLVRSKFADREACVFVGDDVAEAFWSQAFDQVVQFDDERYVGKPLRCNLVVIDGAYTYCPRIQHYLRTRVPVIIVNKAECVASRLMALVDRDTSPQCLDTP